MISSNNEYATTYTPVRRGSNGKLEYQFSLGANHIKFSTQSRITGEGTSYIQIEQVLFKLTLSPLNNISVEMCSSMMVVEDTSPPYSKICPSGIVRHSQLNRQFPFDPRFQDNTGIASIDISGLPGISFLLYTI